MTFASFILMVSLLYVFECPPILTTTIVGSGKSAPTGEEHLEALRAVLQRFPKVHLYALDALISHIRM